MKISSFSTSGNKGREWAEIASGMIHNQLLDETHAATSGELRVGGCSVFIFHLPVNYDRFITLWP